MLRAADAYAHDSQRLKLCQFGQYASGVCRSQVPHQVRYQGDLNIWHAVQTTTHRLDESSGLQAARIEPRWRKERLDVSNVLVCQTAAHRLGEEGEIFVLSQEAVLPSPGFEEMRNISETESVSQRLHVGDTGFTAVLLDKLPQRIQWNRTLQMEVQFDFWHTPVPMGEVAVVLRVRPIHGDLHGT